MKFPEFDQIQLSSSPSPQFPHFSLGKQANRFRSVQNSLWVELDSYSFTFTNSSRKVQKIFRLTYFLIVQPRTTSNQSTRFIRCEPLTGSNSPHPQTYPQSSLRCLDSSSLAPIAAHSSPASTSRSPGASRLDRSQRQRDAKRAPATLPSRNSCPSLLLSDPIGCSSNSRAQRRADWQPNQRTEDRDALEFCCCCRV